MDEVLGREDAEFGPIIADCDVCNGRWPRHCGLCDREINEHSYVTIDINDPYERMVLCEDCGTNLQHYYYCSDPLFRHIHNPALKTEEARDAVEP